MSSAANSKSNTGKNRHKLHLDQRACSIPYKRAFVTAVLTSLIYYLGLVALITTVIAFISSPPDLKRGAAHALVGMLVVCCLLWLICYIFRRKALCPLCKSTPFLDNHAGRHEKAYRCKPLNHGTTAILSVLFSQRWRCMHCGTPFDLLKKPSRQRQLEPPSAPKTAPKK